jgi:transcription elongation factor Elf1
MVVTVQRVQCFRCLRLYIVRLDGVARCPGCGSNQNVEVPMAIQPKDIASEPVDFVDDEYMDTGVLREERICVECGDDLACQGYSKCSDCLEKFGED